MASSSGSNRTGKGASSSDSHRTEKEASSSCTPNSELGERGKEVAETRNWVDGLPYDVAVAMLQNIGSVDILENVQKVCVSWRKICQDPALWRSIDIHNNGNTYFMPNDLVEMTKHAIDLSCGQLTDISLDGFGDNDLLQYLSDRKNQLKSLRMVRCWEISSEGLSLAAMKLPSLEEVHIYFGSITHLGLKSVGLSCPGLKSLTYNQQGWMPSSESDEEDYEGAEIDLNSDAFAISTSMPELRHLSLFGNEMTSRGLQAILDGCPHLESLDLRQCFRVNLLADGELYKRCSSIKAFRSPHDSTNDYGFDPTIRYDDDHYDDLHSDDGSSHSDYSYCN